MGHLWGMLRGTSLVYSPWEFTPEAPRETTDMSSRLLLGFILAVQGTRMESMSIGVMLTQSTCAVGACSQNGQADRAFYPVGRTWEKHSEWHFSLFFVRAFSSTVLQFSVWLWPDSAALAHWEQG